MDIVLDRLSKRYIHEWVFKDVSENIASGSKTALIGPNGSGKSTLLQIIGGYRLPSTGNIQYISGDKNISGDEVFSKVSFAAPYLELIEEFTLKEQLDFHFTWRNSIISPQQIISIFGLEKAFNKPVKYFSSGMKQRLKLGLAFATASELLLLDEPTSNLDQSGIEVYEQCLKDFIGDRTLIIASNEPREYIICENQIIINNFK